MGNQLVGGDYSGTLIIDNNVGLAYPTPLLAERPLGSLIHDGQEAPGAFNGIGDVDDYSLNLDAGQTLSVGLFPVDASFRARLEVFDPNGNLLTDANGTSQFDTSDFGQLAVLNTLPAIDAGLYLIHVTSLEGEGRYQVGVMLNATAEARNVRIRQQR